MNAKWIWKDETLVNDYALFIKDFNLLNVNNSVIKISAHNHFKLWINNKLVSDYVVPASSVADKQKLYLEYDITKYLIKGKNQIKALVLYFGAYGQNYKKAHPGLWCDINLGDSHIVTDESWLVTDYTNYIKEMPFQQSRKITPVEKFDSRISITVDKFKNAKLSKMNELNIIMDKQMINGGTIYERIEPIFVDYKEGISIFDTGKIISGFVEFNLDGFNNQEITIRYSENLNDLGFVGHNVANEFSDDYKDIFIMGNEEKYNHQFDFTYKAFRYFQIENYPKKVNKEEVKALFSATKVTIIEENKINSSDPRVNKLYEMFIQTQKNNIQGLLVDCPHREQAQYLGDSDIQLESIITNIKESEFLIEKVLTDFSFEQFSDGTFPFVAPTNYVEPFTLKIPEYDLYFGSILYKLYEVTKDIKRVEKYLPTFIKSMDYSYKLMDSKNILRKTSDWHISDWPYPTVDHDCQYLTTYNLLYLNNLKYLILFFELLNIPSDNYKETYEKLYKGIRTHLMSDGLLLDGYKSENKHQGVNALGLLSDIFKEEEINNVLDYIETCGFSSSVILGRSVLKALQKYNRMDFVYKYIFDFEKGWTPMIKKGNLTFFEGYDDIESHCHAWQGFPIRVIQDEIFKNKKR